MSKEASSSNLDPNKNQRLARVTDPAYELLPLPSSEPAPAVRPGAEVPTPWSKHAKAGRGMPRQKFNASALRRFNASTLRHQVSALRHTPVTVRLAGQPLRSLTGLELPLASAGAQARASARARAMARLPGSRDGGGATGGAYTVGGGALRARPLHLLRRQRPWGGREPADHRCRAIGIDCRRSPPSGARARTGARGGGSLQEDGRLVEQRLEASPQKSVGHPAVATLTPTTPH